MEDVTVYLKAVYHGFDIAQLYDESVGHAKIQSDRLSVNMMNVTAGGTVPSMKSISIPELVNYPTNFAIGEE